MRMILFVAGVMLAVAGLVVLTSTSVQDHLLVLMSQWKQKPSSPHWLSKLEVVSADILLDGIIIIIFSGFVMGRWNSWAKYLHGLGTDRRRLLRFAALIIILLWLPTILIGQSATIAGERYWWLYDDPMISMRYAHNFVRGFGLVWNPGDPIEGYTNFLWTMYMAAVHLAPIALSKTSVVILLTNTVLALAILPFLPRLVDELGGGTLARVGVTLAFAMSRIIFYWTKLGFETTLVTFLVVVILVRILSESRSTRPRFATYLLLGVLTLVRADAVVLSGLLCLLSLVLNPRKRTVFLYSFISLVPFAGQEVFRIIYYGDFLPNTARLKSMNWDGKYITGLRYVLDFVANNFLLLAFAVAGVIKTRNRTHRMLLGMFGMYTLYVIAAGGDSFVNSRFFMPMLPLVFALAFIAMERILTRPFPRQAMAVLAVASMPLIMPGYGFFNSLFYDREECGNIELGLLIKNNTSPKAKVADTWAGSIFYFSDRPGIDLLGKMDRHIAMSKAITNWSGHNKFDYDYSLGTVRPDIVVSPFKIPSPDDSLRSVAIEIEMQRIAHQDNAFIAALYYHPLFRQHYLGNEASANVWRTILVADWSGEFAMRNSWKKLSP